MGKLETWLDSLELGIYANTFKDNDIEWSGLPDLTHELLRELGIRSVGHRMKLLKAIASLSMPPESTGGGALEAAATRSPAAMNDVAERRQLTVMFVDLVDSTELSQRLDPEDMRQVMLANQNAVAAKITGPG